MRSVAPRASEKKNEAASVHQRRCESLGTVAVLREDDEFKMACVRWVYGIASDGALVERSLKSAETVAGGMSRLMLMNS